ncbi:MAG: hypothetical protein K9J12_13090 [Melioribacteraceae bacterium]|nr:hypothetical protein [Melioribacteraceae bacterium]MCF8264396.1 hypothetical protein [Melioribacteraceae bacterium]
MFYKNLLNNESAKEAISEFGITVEKLNEGKALIEAAEDDKVNRKKMGDVQQATKDREKKVDEL